LERFVKEAAGLDGLDFIFALLLHSMRLTAREVVNPMPGDLCGPQSIVPPAYSSATPDCIVYDITGEQIRKILCRNNRLGWNNGSY
jgi:hypothetical protein